MKIRNSKRNRRQQYHMHTVTHHIRYPEMLLSQAIMRMCWGWL